MAPLTEQDLIHETTIEVLRFQLKTAREDAQRWESFYNGLCNGVIDFCDTLGFQTERYDTDGFDPAQMIEEYGQALGEQIKPIVAAWEAAKDEE